MYQRTLSHSDQPDSSPRVGILNNASGFTINKGRFEAIGSQHNYYNTDGRIGLMELYRASMPEAAFDASARKYAPRCYPGTREQHIEDFTFWVSDTDDTQAERFQGAWMSGPAVVGKSAIAQTCAEGVGKDRLGAAFFFSRPNGRDDPDCLFPSIAYQISTRVEPIAAILDRKIRNDPSIVTKTLDIQLRELIIAPFLELRERKLEIQQRVVIIDGLDECQDDRSQRTIIQLIANAIRDHGDKVPLLWAMFSRPEVHIAQTFSSNIVSPLFWKTALSVSRDLDGEIELYLRGGFEKIRNNHPSLDPDATWPSDDKVAKLVSKTAGLYAYASTAMNYIGDPDALDPNEQLDDVLSLRPRRSYLMNDQPNPTVDLDSLYTLIMKRIPPRLLLLIQRMLLMREEITTFKHNQGLHTVILILGISYSSAVVALSKLSSVFAIEPKDSFRHDPLKLRFHHASFMEFLHDVNRSGPKFCLKQPRCYEFMATKTIEFLISLNNDSSDPWRMRARYNGRGAASIYLSRWLGECDIEEDLAVLFMGINFKTHDMVGFKDDDVPKKIYRKLPQSYRDQILKSDGSHPLYTIMTWILKNEGKENESPEWN